MYNQQFEDWKKEVFYPQACANISLVLPQMEFEPTGTGWRSKRHLNGERDRKGEYVTSVTRDFPFNVHHFGGKGSEYGNAGGNVEIVRLKSLLEGTDYAAALHSAAEALGLTVPAAATEEELAQYGKQQEERNAARSAFVKALWSGSEEAGEVLGYLHSRKWTDEEIKLAGFGLVTAEGKAAVSDTEGLFGKRAIGTTHRLVITYWTGGRIAGFVFRRTDGKSDPPKYLNTEGLGRGLALFGASHCKDIVLVEGYLDALKALALGAKNIAACGGAPTEGQILDAVKRGAESVTLLFDSDESGRKFVRPAIDIASRASSGKTRVYVASLPESMDLDEYLTDNSLESLNGEILGKALSAAAWKFGDILDRAEDLQREKGGITYKERDSLLGEVADIITDPSTTPQDKDKIFSELKMFENALKIDLESFKAYLNTLYRQEREKRANEELGAKLGEIAGLFAKGRGREARKRLRATYEAAAKEERGEEYAEVFHTPTEEEAAQIIGAVREGVPTGITFKEGKREEKLTLNAGITLVCANRSHGKTTFLNNMALNEARRNRLLKTGQTVLYFSYEIPRNRLLLDLLATFVGDGSLSKDVSLSILHYFKYGNDTEKRSQYISRQPLGEDFELCPDYFPKGAKPRGYTHLEHFEIMKDAFFRDYIATGAITIADRSYRVEELLPAIEFYLSVRPVSVIFIDYAQLVYSEEYTRQRTEEIKQVVTKIKNFANERGIPVVMAAQFNREVTSPATVDTVNIGEGGDFERIADTIIGLFNLKELKSLAFAGKNAEDKETRKILKRFKLTTGEKEEDLQPLKSFVYAKLLKRRYGDFPLDTVLKWDGAIKKIHQNDPRAALTIPDYYYTIDTNTNKVDEEPNFFGRDTASDEEDEWWNR